MVSNVQNQIEIEMFVHGAVCIAYSGRCMLSSNMCLRDANNGGCAQSCRWVSELLKENNSLSNTFSMSAKDMCLINYIDKIKSIGISSIKIEGRMKSEHYIATIINAYSKVLNNGISAEYINDVLTAANRDTSVA
jgi:putative protease